MPRFILPIENIIRAYLMPSKYQVEQEFKNVITELVPRYKSKRKNGMTFMIQDLKFTFRNV